MDAGKLILQSHADTHSPASGPRMAVGRDRVT